VFAKLKRHPQSGRKYLLAVYETEDWQPENTRSSKN
jgi:hypothetical protein